MLQSIKVVIKNGWLPVVVEGDSSVLFQMANHLSNGKSMEKVSSSWNLASRLETLSIIIMAHTSISFQHIRRDANKVVDLLEKVGVDVSGAHRMGRMEDFDAKKWMTRCRQLVTHDIGMGGHVMEDMMEDRDRDSRHRESSVDLADRHT